MKGNLEFNSINIWMSIMSVLSLLLLFAKTEQAVVVAVLLIVGSSGITAVVSEMTWISSSDLCVSKNKRLVYMMFYSRQPEFFQFLSQLSADKGVGEITFWTIHKVNDTTGKGERFYTDFPADNFMYDATSLLCVYLVYEAASKTIGWEADDCDDNTVKHFSFCDDRVNNYEEYENLKEITLFEKSVAWEEANTYCNQMNSSLILTDERSLFEQICSQSLRELNLTSFSTFWIGQKYYEKVDGALEFPAIGNQVINNDSFCWYATTDWVDGSFRLLWSTEYCQTPLHGFMCEHRTEKLHFYELWNYAIKRKIPIRSIITNRVTECKEQCSEIREYGLYCIGFNFDRTLQQCMLLGEPSTEYDTTSEYDITSFRMIEGMTAYCRMDGKVQIGEYKPLYESGASTSDETTTVKDNAETDRIMNDERDMTALQSEQSTVSKNIGQFSGGEQSVAGLSLQITMGFIGIISSAVVLYHAIRMILLVKQMLPNTSNEQITQTEVEDHLTDTVTSCITDTDDERIYTIRDIYLNVPPLGHIDVIFK